MRPCSQVVCISFPLLPWQPQQLRRDARLGSEQMGVNCSEVSRFSPGGGCKEACGAVRSLHPCTPQSILSSSRRCHGDDGRVAGRLRQAGETGTDLPLLSSSPSCGCPVLACKISTCCFFRIAKNVRRAQLHRAHHLAFTVANQMATPESPPSRTGVQQLLSPLVIPSNRHSEELSLPPNTGRRT